MATTSDILVLLKFYASKRKSPFIEYQEFINYVKSYAQHHLEEQEELYAYLDSSTIIGKLDSYAESQDIFIITKKNEREILVKAVLISRILKIYEKVKATQTVPFPCISDLPKEIPDEIFYKISSDIFFEEIAKKKNDNNKNIIYEIIMPQKMDSIIYPSCIPIDNLLTITLGKIRTMLQKKEYHDYFLKKIRISNPGKEISSKNFFSQLLERPDLFVFELKETGDKFYFFTQLCYFIKKDFEKVKDLTHEDVGILQSVYISEMIMASYKNMAQTNQKRKGALEALEKNLLKPPYYYDLTEISKFTNEKGIQLKTLYTDADLKNFLEKETTSSENETSHSLPRLLVFKVDNGTRYFIYKNKVMSLIIRLCNSAHNEIQEKLKQKWLDKLKEFEKIPELKNQILFDRKLESEVKQSFPVLYAILNANFLYFVQMETHTESLSESVNLFDNNKLIPYSQLLLIDRQKLLTDTKVMLPFWYSIPIFSWFVSLFKTNKQKQGYMQKQSDSSSMNDAEPQLLKKNIKQKSKKEAINEAARKLEEEMIPQESSLDRELKSYLHLWNKLITKEASRTLTEDVNCLIRDYLRKVIKTINAVNFTHQRLEELASTLANTPSLRKINETEALKMYIQFYMLYLIKKS